MKVLFCSPYLNSDSIVKGGINSWGNYIVSYHKSLDESRVDLIPISFDRKKREVAEVNDTSCQRLYSGIKEVGASVKKAINAMSFQQPEVMHLCTSASIGLMKDIILLRAAQRRNIKSVIHLHFGRTSDLKQKKNWEWKLLMKVVRLADVVVSMDQKTYTILYELAGDKVRYLPNPLPLSITDQINELGGTIERVPGQLLFVGHTLRTKGIYELVEGCCNVDATTVRIVGKTIPEVRKELEVIANRRDYGKWLTFVGEIPHSEVIKEFLAADAFVFPSYTEGFPNVILEAMACGCPIASSNVGAIPEMLDVDGEPCGICYEPQHAEYVTAAVLRLWDNPTLKTQMSERAKKRVNNHYSIPIVWKQLVEIWKK